MANRINPQSPNPVPDMRGGNFRIIPVGSKEYDDHWKQCCAKVLDKASMGRNAVPKLAYQSTKCPNYLQLASSSIPGNGQSTEICESPWNRVICGEHRLVECADCWTVYEVPHEAFFPQPLKKPTIPEGYQEPPAILDSMNSSERRIWKLDEEQRALTERTKYNEELATFLKDNDYYAYARSFKFSTICPIINREHQLGDPEVVFCSTCEKEHKDAQLCRVCRAFVCENSLCSAASVGFPEEEGLKREGTPDSASADAESSREGSPSSNRSESSSDQQSREQASPQPGPSRPASVHSNGSRGSGRSSRQRHEASCPPDAEIHEQNQLDRERKRDRSETPLAEGASGGSGDHVAGRNADGTDGDARRVRGRVNSPAVEPEARDPNTVSDE